MQIPCRKQLKNWNSSTITPWIWFYRVEPEENCNLLSASIYPPKLTSCTLISEQAEFRLLCILMRSQQSPLKFSSTWFEKKRHEMMCAGSGRRLHACDAWAFSRQESVRSLRSVPWPCRHREEVLPTLGWGQHHRGLGVQALRPLPGQHHGQAHHPHQIKKRHLPSWLALLGRIHTSSSLQVSR